MSSPASTSSDNLLSSDGVLIGPVLGTHRHPVTRAALWAVVASGGRSILVSLEGAALEPGMIRAAYDAERVRSSPMVTDPTRLDAADESRLRSHYGSPRPGVSSPRQLEGGRGISTAERPADELSVVRSEERLEVRALEWRPYQRVRLRTVIRSREEKRTVQVRWEELVVENEPLSAVERLELSAGLAQVDAADVEVVLHREEVLVTTRVVPYEVVRATRSTVTEEQQVTETLRKEQIDIDEELVTADAAKPRSRRGRRR